MMLRTLALFLLATLVVAFTADPVAAASVTQMPDHAPLFADYWDGFIEHWSKAFKKQNGIVMTAILVGVVCLFIITRGKWRK